MLGLHLLIENVAKVYKAGRHEFPAIKDFNLEIESGEFVCIVGPSGCGKTTLLSIIAGLEKASRGRVLVCGKEINAPGQDMALIFQESALFPWLRVIENVEFGMKMAGIPRKKRRESALEYLSMVHLEQFQNAFVHQLSGGMKQRVAIARALASNSRLLLMDEPFAAVDEQTKRMLHLELLQIWQETKKTIVFVTHNVEEAVFLADRIVLMSPAPGKINKVVNVTLERPRRMTEKEWNLIQEVKGTVQSSANS